MNPNISLFMSASRPQWWQRMYESLLGNQCSWEIIAVGPNKPKWKLPPNFRFYECHFKPCQCYAAASYFCQGDLIGWTCDDSFYLPNSLDRIWREYQKYAKGVIYAQRTFENGKDVTEEHHFIRYDEKTPRMAPMAFMDKKRFWEIGGYDLNFVSGQAENDIVLREGGNVAVIESRVYITHEQVHGGIINKLKYKFGKNSFRSGYWSDRRYLEECWVLPNGEISKTRLLPLHPFNYDNILTVAQGPQARWSKNG